MAALVILVAEGHLAVLQGHETMVGNGHTVGIAGQVLQDVPGVVVYPTTADNYFAPKTG